jgi:hypothetical protein
VFAAASGQAAIVALAWCTLVFHAALMIALTWRWAFQYEAWTIFGAGVLSALMMGFIGAAAIVVQSLGRTAESQSVDVDELPDALLLFPAEASSTNDRDRAPQLLAPRQKALL